MTYGDNRIGEKPPPPVRLKVHVSEVQGKVHIRSKALSVYGLAYERALELIEDALRGEVENEDEQERDPDREQSLGA
jgi:hypothetical protein